MIIVMSRRAAEADIAGVVAFIRSRVCENTFLTATSVPSSAQSATIGF